MAYHPIHNYTYDSNTAGFGGSSPLPIPPGTGPPGWTFPHYGYGHHSPVFGYGYGPLLPNPGATRSATATDDQQLVEALPG